MVLYTRNYSVQFNSRASSAALYYRYVRGKKNVQNTKKGGEYDNILINQMRLLHVSSH